MSRRYSRRRSQQDDPLGLLILVLIIGGIVAYVNLSVVQRVLALLCLLLIAVLIVLWVRQRNVYRVKKLRALEVIDIDQMDGLAFEEYVAEILRHKGYKNVSLTEYYDWGVDVIAEKDGVRWGVQVKRYAGVVKADAVRQVVTGLNKYHCARGMVVTNSTYTRQARVLAESNNCVLVDKDMLAEWMVKFQANGELKVKPRV
ncbi:MAG: restriction endonuclease [Candidatus Saccharimonadales bacterium]